jgi:hypothetical protein
MAFSELELEQCERDLARFMALRRPLAHIRPELDIGYKVKRQSIEIFELRPHWRDKTRKIETPVAKATLVRTRDRWRIYWRRADLRWHGDEPNYEARSFAEFLAIVDRDEYACFFG